MKGLIKIIQQYKNAHPRQAVEPTELLSAFHNIVDQGEMYKNVQCAVCSHIANVSGIRGSLASTQIRLSKFWYLHPDCHSHACREHRDVVNSYMEDGIVLQRYHNMKRIEHTIQNPGKYIKPEGSGQQSVFEFEAEYESS